MYRINNEDQREMLRFRYGIMDEDVIKERINKVSKKNGNVWLVDYIVVLCKEFDDFHASKSLFWLRLFNNEIGLQQVYDYKKRREKRENRIKKIKQNEENCEIIRDFLKWVKNNGIDLRCAAEKRQTRKKSPQYRFWIEEVCYKKENSKVNLDNSAWYGCSRSKFYGLVNKIIHREPLGERVLVSVKWNETRNQQCMYLDGFSFLENLDLIELQEKAFELSIAFFNGNMEKVLYKYIEHVRVRA